MAYQAKTVISIHAPVKGATSVQGFAGAYRKDHISIHAPVKGATRVNSLFKELGFQISIHAPVKGATCQNEPWNEGLVIFQSTHP